jgi:hypothetical protein
LGISESEKEKLQTKTIMEDQNDKEEGEEDGY